MKTQILRNLRYERENVKRIRLLNRAKRDWCSDSVQAKFQFSEFALRAETEVASEPGCKGGYNLEPARTFLSIRKLDARFGVFAVPRPYRIGQECPARWSARNRAFARGTRKRCVFPVKVDEVALPAYRGTHDACYSRLHLTNGSPSTRSCQSSRATFFAICGNIPRRRIPSKVSQFGGCRTGPSNYGCRRCARLWWPWSDMVTWKSTPSEEMSSIAFVLRDGHEPRSGSD